MSGAPFVKRGSRVGSGAIITITTGFKPVKVEVFNEDGLALAVKTETMAADSGMKQITAGTMTFPASLITLLDNGFQIQADADINVVDEILHWVAWQAVND